MSLRLEGAGSRDYSPIPLADEVAEGVALCVFIVRLQLKNRILVEVLTAAVEPTTAASTWSAFLVTELRRTARRARAESRRIQRLKQLTEEAAGTAWTPHDYRHSDAGLLERRSRAGRAVARELRRLASNRPGVRSLLAAAAAAAYEEVMQAMRTGGIDPVDQRQVLDRLSIVIELSG